MKLTIPKLKIADDEGFNPDKDIFNRKDFGERLANLVEQSDGNLVIALDAKWGEGKSTFIQMWRGYIEHKREDKIKSIYFDAFVNDYQKDPFLALVSEIYELLKDKSKDKKDEFKRKAGNAVKSMARGALKIGVRGVSGGFLDGSIVDTYEKDISKLLSEQVDEIISDKLQNTEKDKLAISQFKEYLEKFVAEETIPIVFIIDELDRCRPDFSLELIEQIKHLFSVKGVTFLLVLNREQLHEAIKSRYGNGVEANLYLQKFINIWLNLPRKSDQYLDHGSQYVRYALNSMLNEGEKFINTEAVELLLELVKYFKPSFREIEQILSYFALIQNMAGDTQYYSHYQSIFSFICYLKVSNPSLINNIISEDINSEELISQSGLDKILKDTESYHTQYLSKLIIFDLSSDDVKKRMIEEKEVSHEAYRHGRDQNKIMKQVCGWLSEIQSS